MALSLRWYLFCMEPHTRISRYIALTPRMISERPGAPFMNLELSENRRKEKRTSVDENVYVVIDTQPEMMGQMVEISSTGMAFTFVDLDSVSQRLKNRDIVRMDFFAAGKGYFIRNLPARLISSTESPSANAISALMIKRIGVEFTILSISQQVQVNSLIRRQNARDIKNTCESSGV